MRVRESGFSGRLIVAMLVMMFLLAPAAFAQDEETPKGEIFVGFQRFDPNEDVGPHGPEGLNGWGTNVTYNLNRWIGLSGDFGGSYGEDYDHSTILFGPRFSVRGDQMTIFTHALFGVSRFGVEEFDGDTAFASAIGAGIDLNVHRNVSLRLVEGDFIFADHEFENNLFSFDNERMNGTRFRTGINFLLGGGAPAAPPSATCSLSASEPMFAGEPLTYTLNGAGFRKNRDVSIALETSGGQLSGGATSMKADELGNVSTTATVNTANLTPGSYTVSGRLTDEKGRAPECDQTFEIKKRPVPPVLSSLTASPTEVTSGEPSTLRATCTSEDGRALSYTYSTSAGRVSGSGPTATLNTTGIPQGTATVTVECADDRGMKAAGAKSATVSVNPRITYCSKRGDWEISFDCTDRPRVCRAPSDRVDNEAKKILDGVALSMQNNSGQSIVIVGQQDTDEKTGKTSLSGRRAANAQAYMLSGEHQMSVERAEERITTRTGDAGGQRAEIWVCNPGDEMNPELSGTQAVDPSVKATQKKWPGAR